MSPSFGLFTSFSNTSLKPARPVLAEAAVTQLAEQAIELSRWVDWCVGQWHEADRRAAGAALSQQARLAATQLFLAASAPPGDRQKRFIKASHALGQVALRLMSVADEAWISAHEFEYGLGRINALEARLAAAPGIG